MCDEIHDEKMGKARKHLEGIKDLSVQVKTAPLSSLPRETYKMLMETREALNKAGKEAQKRIDAEQRAQIEYMLKNPFIIG